MDRGIGGSCTYILIKSRVVKVDWVGPRVRVPDVVGPDVEAAGEDAFLVRGLIVSDCTPFP
jgi:hypothetical protein